MNAESRTSPAPATRPAAAPERWAKLAPLFLVSMAAVGYEIALARYFAVAQWSEYGYWVISIVMVGFALSGVVLALARDRAARHGKVLLSVLPVLLVAAAALGFHWTVTNPFNPLQLQNPATWQGQVGNIALYYACLLPVFFLAGAYIGLSFILNADRIGRTYGFDLLGAGCGAMLALGLMLVLHPFQLVPALLVPLAAAAFFAPWRRGAMVAAALLALLGGEALLRLGPQPDFNDFKAIYAPLHVPDAQVVAERRTPRGHYLLLDDFMERVDTDISNNAGLLGLPGPPTSFGLYRDGNRIAALPRPEGAETGYAPSALDALPYLLRPEARVLLAGASGGFRARGALTLGAADVTVLEPEPVLRGALTEGFGPSPALPPDPRLTISGESPLAVARRAARSGRRFDVIDLSADFLDAAEANASALSAEAIAAYWNALAPDGVLSLPVSIRDFPVYALRLLATVRAGLLAVGVADPAAQVAVYRSAWSVRVLVSRSGWDAARLEALRRFADERSFDIVYHPGFDADAARDHLYNDLPAVSFESGQVTSEGPADAIADEAVAVLQARDTPSAEAFNLRPVTLDRPAFYAVLRLDQLGTLLKRLEILPQQEIGALVNLAVLAQALVIALLVLLVPLLGRVKAPRAVMARAIVYFPCLGLGFLFLEIVLIERASFWLNDRTSGFALVLTGMLVFSGLGSMLAGRFGADPRRGMYLATGVVLAWGAALLLGLEPLILGTLDLPWAARAALVLLLVAPGSVALGLPFPLGLARAGGMGGLLPWAWALNGAFSVVSTPLANLLAREAGFDVIILTGILLYALAAATFPIARNTALAANAERRPVTP
ncbi:hypothetical protein M0638_21515 [Roseomonas sp. NAR14]|uniref:Spermidine synthase n=1 Tax=Roseomonas acroporae TaxID=2937791 RepID=A0A9X1YC19_9PROT|nr:hypothetical protein [Roseomonas acroporae]MCK8786955.1 hypothetical protein [Roseomonas acroporae]